MKLRQLSLSGQAQAAQRLTQYNANPPN